MLKGNPDNYRSTALYRSLVSDKSSGPASPREHYRYLINFTPAATTWDAYHFGKFLDQSEFCVNSPSASLRNSQFPSSATSPKSSNTYTSPRKDMVSSYLKSSKSKESLAFRGTSRFNLIEEKEYNLNIFKDFGFKEAQNNVNALSMLSPVKPEVAEQQFKESMIPMRKSYEPSKLDIQMLHDTGLKSPKDRLDEIKEVKANQSEFEKYKNQINDMTRRQKIYKNGFKSGVLGMDNPFNPDTQFYKAQHDQILNKQKNIEDIEKRRVKQLEDKRDSHASLEFFNRKFTKAAVEPPVHMVEKNVKKHVDLPHVKTWKDSKHRLFGDLDNKRSQGREKHLLEMDKRNRDYNIVNLALEKAKTEQSRSE